MSKINLTELKERGFTLSKADAQELHPLINHVSQRGDTENEVYPGDGDAGEGAGNIVELKRQLSEAEIIITNSDKIIIDQHNTIVDLQDKISELTNGTNTGSINTNESQEQPEPAAENNKAAAAAAFHFSIAPAGEHHATKKKRLKDSGFVEHVVTQDYIDAHPELAQSNVKVGDTIEVPAPKE